jgi:hypothetical protein
LGSPLASTKVQANIEAESMKKPMNEDTTARGSADRTAIERWEQEGGSVLEQGQDRAEDAQAIVPSPVERAENVKGPNGPKPRADGAGHISGDGRTPHTCSPAAALARGSVPMMANRDKNTGLPTV